MCNTVKQSSNHHHHHQFIFRNVDNGKMNIKQHRKATREAARLNELVAYAVKVTVRPIIVT